VEESGEWREEEKIKIESWKRERRC